MWLADGGEAAVEGESFTTYNLAVAGFHTFFVGQHGVWVHNAGARGCDKIVSVVADLLENKQLFAKLDAIPTPSLLKAVDIKEYIRTLRNLQSKWLALGDWTACPTYRQMKAHLEKWPGVQDGWHFTQSGKKMANGFESHHIVRKKFLKKIKGLENFVEDDVPAFAIDMAKHRGAGVGESIENIVGPALRNVTKPLDRPAAARVFKDIYESDAMIRLLGEPEALALSKVAQDFILKAGL